MAHWSEDNCKLEIVDVKINDLSQLENIEGGAPDVYFFRLPFSTSVSDANTSNAAFEKLSEWCGELNTQAVVCVLTTPGTAALLLLHLEKKLRVQLWIAVKTTLDKNALPKNALPGNHAALLVFTRYDSSLRHTKTRVQYTACPACRKTTKDYGGKKHTYHEYGTLLSDVWRDVECNLLENIDAVVNRVSDLFGLEPHRKLYLFELQGCSELQIIEQAREQTMAIEESKVRLNNCLINDDCLIALKNIPDNSIDFCFADPPYNLKKKYDKWNDGLDSAEYFAWCDRWLSELYRVLKPQRTLAILNIPFLAARHFQHLASFAAFQSWIAWDALSFPVRRIMPAHYAITCFSKGEARRLPYSTSDTDSFSALKEFYCLRANCVSARAKAGIADRDSITDLWHDIHRLKHNSRRVDHPCQLPPELMRRLYGVFTQPDEIVLDCFNGAGTSTLVAAQMSRRYIGIEMSEQYHEIALIRHEQLLQGVDPFGKVTAIPTAKNSQVGRLAKQKYKVSKKELQLEVKRIALELERLPTKNDVQAMSRFPIKHFEEYFVSWGEVCAAARTTGMTEDVSVVPDYA